MLDEELEVELQDAVDERCNVVNGDLGGYDEEAVCRKMAEQ